MTIHTRPQIELDERRCFTPMQKVKLFQRAKGRCELCGVKIRGAWIAGHITPHAMGGKTTLENGRVECRDCAKDTHSKDTADAARCERMAGRKGQYARRRRNGPKLKSNAKLQSRNTLGGEEYLKRKAWKEKMERGK